MHVLDSTAQCGEQVVHSENFGGTSVLGVSASLRMKLCCIVTFRARTTPVGPHPCCDHAGCFHEIKMSFHLGAPCTKCYLTYDDSVNLPSVQLQTMLYSMLFTMTLTDAHIRRNHCERLAACPLAYHFPRPCHYPRPPPATLSAVPTRPAHRQSSPAYPSSSSLHSHQ